MEEIISLDNVSYIRNGKYILKDINWHVNRGEHWVILGPNGSGKTTTLNMVNGYIFPSQGHVKVLEFEFGHSSIIELRKRIGWVSSASASSSRPTTIRCTSSSPANLLPLVFGKRWTTTTSLAPTRSSICSRSAISPSANTACSARAKSRRCSSAVR